MAYFGGAKTERPIPKLDLRTSFLIGWGVVLFIAIVYAALNPNMFSNLTKQSEAVVQQPAIPMAEVLVPRRTIKTGDALNRSLFIMELRPIEGIEDKVITDFRTIRKHYAKTVIAKGIPLFRQHITTEMPRNIVTARIPKGFRAVSIPVNAESGVEGWVRPGVRVDVVWATVRRSKEIVTTIVENAQVLSAGKNVDKSNLSDSDTKELYVPKFITLMVPREDAQKIQLAKTSGSLTLNLRGDIDKEMAGSDTLTIDSLLRPIDQQYLQETQGGIKIGDNHYVLKGGRLKKVSKHDPAIAERFYFEEE